MTTNTLANSKKAYEMAQDLREIFARNFATVGSVAEVATYGGYSFTFGAGTAGTDSGIIRVGAIVPLGTNAFGSAQSAYSQHVIQIGAESTTSGANDPADLSVWSFEALLEIFAPCALMGAKLELYTKANGTAAAAIGDLQGVPAKTWDPSQQWKTASSV